MYLIEKLVLFVVVFPGGYQRRHLRGITLRTVNAKIVLHISAILCQLPYVVQLPFDDILLTISETRCVQVCKLLFLHCEL